MKAGTGDETLAPLPVPERQFGMDRPSPPHTLSLFGPKTGRRTALTAPTVFTGDVTAQRFLAPIPDGSFSLWSTDSGPNSDGSQDGISSWGFNMFAGGFKVDPLKAGMVLEFESGYLVPGAQKQAEAYIQFENTDNTIVRPFQIEIPLAGARMNHPVMFTFGDFFSFGNWDGSKQWVKVYDLGLAIARNLPLLFTNTNDCAGCGLEVGLKPFGPGELAVIAGGGLGNFRAWTVSASTVSATAVSATTLSGNGSEITNLSGYNIRPRTLPDALLTPYVALLYRGNEFLTTQFFDTTGWSGQPGVAIRGSINNPIPNLSISSTVLPTGHDWRIASRGDNGALVVSNETDHTAGGKLAIDTAGNVWVAKDLVVQGKVRVPEGPNASIGQVDLVGGIATVTSTFARSTSRIFLTRAGAVGTLGQLYVGTIIHGVSFEIRSSSSTDSSPVNYWIVN